jgi:anti-anti-sigma regulatory factor
MISFQFVREGSNTGSAVVRLIGCADVSSAAALALLEAQLCSDSDVTLNVAAMYFGDTTFLRFLVRLKPFPYSDNPRAITLVGVSPQLKRALEITGLARFLQWR